MIKDTIKILETNIDCLEKDKKFIESQICLPSELRRLSRLFSSLTIKQAQIEILNEIYSEIKNLEDKNAREKM